MTKRALLLSVLSSTAILVTGWQLGSQATSSVTATVSPAEPAGSAGSAPAPTPLPSSSSSSGGTSSGTASPSASPTTAAVSGTFTGDSVQTRYGAVQVQITVASGTISEVTALHLTDADGRSVSISNRAAPVLRQEALAAQSAQVQGVSGATYTSQAYLTSLQSAIDQAGITP